MWWLALNEINLSDTVCVIWTLISNTLPILPYFCPVCNVQLKTLLHFEIKLSWNEF